MARREIALAEYLDEQREAAGFYIDIGGGETVCMVPHLLFPTNWSEILAEGDPRSILVAVFGGAENGGEEQLDRFLAAPGANLGIGLHFVYKHLGIPLGESPASSSSSTSDGPSSRPTSAATTSSTSSTSGGLASPGDVSPGSPGNSPESPRRSTRSSRKKPSGG